MARSFVPRAALVCALAGMRTASPHALMQIGRVLERNGDNSGQSLLDTPVVAVLVGIGAAGELVIDKLPFTPNRTNPVALGARMLSGALAGALLWHAHKRPFWHGIIVGALAAALNTVVSFYARRLLVNALGVPDLVVAFAEDAAVYAGGWQLVHMLNQELADRA